MDREVRTRHRSDLSKDPLTDHTTTKTFTHTALTVEDHTHTPQITNGKSLDIRQTVCVCVCVSVRERKRENER